MFRIQFIRLAAAVAATAFASLPLTATALALDLGIDLGGVGSVDVGVGGGRGIDLDVELGGGSGGPGVGVDVDLGGSGKGGRGGGLDLVPRNDGLTLGQDQASKAVRDRRALPLEDILLRAKLLTDGDVIDAQLISVQDVLLYELKVLGKAGDVSELYFYARSGLPVGIN